MLDYFSFVHVTVWILDHDLFLIFAILIQCIFTFKIFCLSVSGIPSFRFFVILVIESFHLVFLVRVVILSTASLIYDVSIMLGLLLLKCSRVAILIGSTHILRLLHTSILHLLSIAHLLKLSGLSR